MYLISIKLVITSVINTTEDSSTRYCTEKNSEYSLSEYSFHGKTTFNP